jgi:GTP-binding protein
VAFSFKFSPYLSIPFIARMQVMKVTKAVFKRGIKGDNEILEDGIPQVAFIGRSNAGKSSLINTLTGVKGLAISSKTPGRTQEINVYLINDTHYFLDLPGYGFTKTKLKIFEKLGKLIYWYLFDSSHTPTVVLLFDAEIGPTDSDLEMLHELERARKNIVVVANKVDKIQKSKYKPHLEKLEKILQGHQVFPFSSQTKVGVAELTEKLLS